MRVICICTQNVINTTRNTHLSDADFVNGVNVEELGYGLWWEQVDLCNIFILLLLMV